MLEIPIATRAYFTFFDARNTCIDAIEYTKNKCVLAKQFQNYSPIESDNADNRARKMNWKSRPLIKRHTNSILTS